MQHADMGKIEELARSEGMRTMYEDGLVKALGGVTTIEEVLRVTQET
jgi:general secretion pathway protein E